MPRGTIHAVDLVSHSAAMDLLWAARGFAGSLPKGQRHAHKHFPNEGHWYWERGSRRVSDPRRIFWLNARWELVEGVFYRYDATLPHIQSPDVKRARPAEMWEWSCIGLHSLWESWCEQRGQVMADLRPAHFDLELDGNFEEKAPEPHELLYPRARLEVLAMSLRQQRELRSWRLLRAPWHGTLAACVARNRLGPSSKPIELRETLVEEGLARRTKLKVVVLAEEGSEAVVTENTFRKVARRALDGTLEVEPAVPSP